MRNLKEGELVWLVDYSLKRCEYKLGRIIEIYTGNDGVVRSAIVKMAHGELNQPAVKLAPVFYDGVSEIENRAGDVGTTSNQLQKPLDSKNNVWKWKLLKFVKTQKWSKLKIFIIWDRKSVYPPEL